MNFLPQGFRNLSSVRQTDTTEIIVFIMPLRGWSTTIRKKSKAWHEVMLKQNPSTVLHFHASLLGPSFPHPAFSALPLHQKTNFFVSSLKWLFDLFGSYGDKKTVFRIRFKM